MLLLLLLLYTKQQLFSISLKGKPRNMVGTLLVHLLLQGVLLYDALGWEVSMPKEIHGLKGSCLVIPCSFSYTLYPPKNPARIVWYQYVSRGYPLVYDPWKPNEVIWKFKGNTDLYRESDWDCSLLIKKLEQSHHGEKLYAWIDPENVGKSTYVFYDVTSTIQVDASPEKPSISIYGGEKMGDTVTVTCSTFHTCPYSEPTITLNGIEGSDKIDNEHIKDGLWKITQTRKGVVKSERLTIQCSVRHYGDREVTAMTVINAKCVHHKIMIEPELTDVTVGITKNFVCSFYHSCQNENPTITWNYKNMQVTTKEKTLPGLNRISYSNIAFLATKEDNGKKLICTAKFSGGDITASVILHVKLICAGLFADVWKVQVESEMEALVSSCVVLPCSFKYPAQQQPSDRIRAIWHMKDNWDDIIFHEDSTRVKDSFKRRTRLIGSLGASNCSLEIDEVKNHDNGPYCFRVELDTSVNDKYSFVDNCVPIKMIEQASKPELQAEQSVQEGQPTVFKCSVQHTCPSHQPTLSWSHPGKAIMSYKDIGHGNWEAESLLIFTPTKEDDYTSITCTVKHHGNIKGEITATHPIFVKEQATFSHIIIPVISGLGAALLVGLLCFFIVKRYKFRSVAGSNRSSGGNIWNLWHVLDYICVAK
uniref:Ig-like domain-containing protein n=1 Tax=Cyprinus carpio TaxID=7962 RepID=A0A8C1XD93_CYPCA